MQYHGNRKDELIVDVHTSDMYLQTLVYIPENRARYTRFRCVDTVGCIHTGIYTRSATVQSYIYVVHILGQIINNLIWTRGQVYVTKTGIRAAALYVYWRKQVLGLVGDAFCSVVSYCSPVRPNHRCEIV